MFREVVDGVADSVASGQLGLDHERAEGVGRFHFRTWLATKAMGRLLSLTVIEILFLKSQQLIAEMADQLDIVQLGHIDTRVQKHEILVESGKDVVSIAENDTEDDIDR